MVKVTLTDELEFLIDVREELDKELQKGIEENENFEELEKARNF